MNRDEIERWLREDSKAFRQETASLDAAGFVERTLATLSLAEGEPAMNDSSSSRYDAARNALYNASRKRIAVNSGLSGALLKLNAAAGLIPMDEGETLPYPEGDPVWTEHARWYLQRALSDCDELRTAIVAAAVEVDKLDPPGATAGDHRKKARPESGEPR